MIASVTAAQGTLYTLGAAVEFVGIVLVASPDLLPGVRRLSRWIGPRFRTLENRVRRLLHLRGRDVVVTVGGGGALRASGSASVMKSIDEGATLERKVAFLLQRDQDAQRDVGALEKRVTAAEQTSVERLDELRGDMETHVSTELATSAAEYRAVRIVGAIAVVIGLGLSTAANFLG